MFWLSGEAYTDIPFLEILNQDLDRSAQALFRACRFVQPGSAWEA